jgi:hypothetical protein
MRVGESVDRVRRFAIVVVHVRDLGEGRSGFRLVRGWRARLTSAMFGYSTPVDIELMGTDDSLLPTCVSTQASSSSLTTLPVLVLPSGPGASSAYIHHHHRRTQEEKLASANATFAGRPIRRPELIRTSSRKFNNLSPSSSESPYSTAVARRRQGTIFSPTFVSPFFFVICGCRRGFRYSEVSKTKKSTNDIISKINEYFLRQTRPIPESFGRDVCY